MANWIKDAVRHKGSLHRALGVPENQSIPAKKLAAAKNSDDPTIAKEANLAATLKGLHKPKSNADRMKSRYGKS